MKIATIQNYDDKMTLSFMFAIVILLNSILMTGCKPAYQSFSYEFTGAFDTVISVVAHLKSQKEFDAFSTYAEKRFQELNKLYDIYHEYPGINNIMSINKNAGVKPVIVKKEIIDLLVFSKEWYGKSNGKFNVAFGSVLKIWHEYRTRADLDSDDNAIPKLSDLKQANQDTSIENIIINSKDSTVFIDDPKVLLDVGAVAKGYATELVANELNAKGYNSFAISAGGNVKVVGIPLAKDRKTWVIGIQNPDPNMNNVPDPNSGLINKVSVIDTSVVTSGWYQRYFMSGGKIYHHIIDPVTLFPQNYYQAITIIYPDSGISDILSTTIMLMPYEDAIKYIAKIPGAEAYFILFNGEVKATPGMAKLLMNPLSFGSKSSSISVGS